MSVISVPVRDERPWPSLGPAIVDWIEENLVFGPGDLLGEPARVDRETRALIRRAYEVWPRGSALEGRRRFTNVAWSLPKGTAKTERAGWVTICEAHPEAPVRFVEWDGEEPVGWGVTDPYIPLLATTEGQAETTTYEAARAVLERSHVADDFDIGLGRIVCRDGRGRIEAVATSPDARDGARTTFQSVDETHRLTDDREKKTYQVMLANVAKRKAADGWTLSTTTGFMPGQESIAETTYELAVSVLQGKHKDPSLCFFHRQADDGHKIARPHEVPGADNEDDVRAALNEAYGPSAEWANLEGMVTLWRNPETDLSYFERVVLNRPVQSESQVFDMNLVRKGIRVQGSAWPRDRSEVALGFDGSKTQDATALIGTEMESGYQFVVGFWEKPEDAEPGWEVPGDEVDQAVADAMKRWRVKLMLADHAFWETYVDRWHGKWPRVCIIFPTSALKKTAYAIRHYVQAWQAGEVTYDGNPHFTDHLGNARKRELTMKDEEGKPLYLMTKDRKGSPFKIDAAYAGMLSWEARSLATQGGALKRAGSKAGRTTVYMG